MSRTLNRRVSTLERALQSGREFYCCKTVFCDSVIYNVFSPKEPRREYHSSAGPFQNRGAAVGWGLEDLKANYPLAYARLLKKRSLEDLVNSEEPLVADALPEFILEMVRTDIDLEALPEDERKLRASYLAQAEEMRTIHAELTRE